MSITDLIQTVPEGIKENGSLLNITFQKWLSKVIENLYLVFEKQLTKNDFHIHGCGGIIVDGTSFNLLCFVLYQTHCLAKHAVFQVLKLTLHIRPVGDHGKNCMGYCDV